MKSSSWRLAAGWLSLDTFLLHSTSPSRSSFHHKFRFMIFTIHSLCIYDDSPVSFYFFLLGLQPLCGSLSYVLTSTIGFVLSKYLSLLPVFHANTCSPWSIPKVLFSHALEVSFLPVRSHHSSVLYTLYLKKVRILFCIIMDVVIIHYL